MRIKPLVTATEYGVCQTTGADIVGVLLDVYKSVPLPTPNTYGHKSETQFAVKNMQFPDHDAADAYCLEHGWLKVYGE